MKLSSCVRGMAGLSLVLLSAPALQAEVYKWTDEAGQVHYGQELPAGAQREAAEVIPVDTRSPAAVVPQGETAQRSCGSVALPASVPDPVANILRLRQVIAILQQAIDENADRSDAAGLQWLADRRCAIELARQELQALGEVGEGIAGNYDLVSGELDDLQQLSAQCDDPEQVGEEITPTACRQQYYPRIKQLEEMLRQLEGRKKMLEPAE